MAGAGDVFRRGPEFHRQHDFGDQIAGFGTDDGAAQHLVGLGVGQDFHKAVRGHDGLGAGIGGEGKLADLVGDAGSLELFFVFADGGDFRESVNHRRDGVVIDVSGLAGDQLGTGHGFIFGLVRQHRAFAAIADGINARHIGAVMIVRDDAAALVEGNPNRVQPQAGGVGDAADGDQHDVALDDALVAARGWFDRHGQAGFLFLDAGDLGAELESEALLGEDALEGLGNFQVNAGRNAVEIFHHRHFGAQALPHRAKLKPDHAGADHQ